MSILQTFRQINYLVISLVKPLLSRSFCQKCVRVTFRNLLLHFYDKKFRERKVYKGVGFTKKKMVKDNFSFFITQLIIHLFNFYLRYSLFQGCINKIVKQLKQRASRNNMAIDQIGNETNQVSCFFPFRSRL